MEGADIEQICAKQDPNNKESFIELLSALDVQRLLTGEPWSISSWLKDYHNNAEFPMSFVLNTSFPGNPEVGHWLAIYFDEKGQCYYFNSYGDKPDTLLKRFCEGIIDYAQRQFPKYRISKEIDCQNREF